MARKSPKRVRAGKKAARTRALRRARRGGLRTRAMAVRRWRRLSGKRRRLSVKRVRRGLMRSPFSRLGYRRGRKVRINPRRRRTFGIGGLMRRWSIGRALPILGGFAGAIAIKNPMKTFIMPYVPISMQQWVERGFGVITVMIGAMVSRRGRRQMTRDVGLGLIVGGVYDIIATNFANLPFINQYLPTVTPPTTSGLGASIGRPGSGAYGIVGASNISMNMEPEIVGAEDLDDLI